MERSIQQLEFKIKQHQDQQKIDTEFYQQFEMRRILNNSSGKRCPKCTGDSAPQGAKKSFSKDRAAAEKEPLRVKRPRATDGWTAFEDP